MSFDSVRFEPAARRFRAFFEDVAGHFEERSDVLAQMALALLAKEHVLLTGPPGTAKSQLASSVFGRIVDDATGEPSLFSRQIGESTVRTDLVGPLDFKTLTETGRSEHFTDEGMLGAVHAFLDEVFDGRDMLLRDALNVLQERELKQGGRIVKGRIECALMTSNRYLAEVLEGSRETLLAFVDRIAFVGFVPRGFADPAALARVLRVHGGSGRLRGFGTSLALSDVDVLQAACDHVELDDDVCERLAELLRAFDRECFAAVRADPSFIPTRYVSTRTAVRAAGILRAIVVRRRIFEDPKRPLRVRLDDLRDLRLHLVLSGPDDRTVEALLLHERDPRERRQLEIARTERAIFERCMRTAMEHPTQRVETELDGVAHDAVWEASIRERVGSPLITVVLEALSELVAAEHAVRLRPEALEELSRSARAHLARAAFVAASKPLAEDVVSLDAYADELAALAESLDASRHIDRSLGRMLRGRAVALLDDAARFDDAGPPSSPLSTGGEGFATARARAYVTSVAERERRRAALVAVGADADVEAGHIRRRTLACIDTELVRRYGAVLDASLRAETHATDAPAASVFDRFVPLLRELADVESHLDGMGVPGGFRARVVGPRVARILARHLGAVEHTRTDEVLAAVRLLQTQIDKLGVADSISPSAWAALVATAWTAVPVAPASLDAGPFGRSGYRDLRAALGASSGTMALAEVALVASAQRTTPGTSLGSVRECVRRAVFDLPTDVRRAIADRDRRAVERSLAYLEAWARAATTDGNDSAESAEALRALLCEERPLVRLALESRAIADVAPEDEEALRSLRRRCEALHEGQVSERGFEAPGASAADAETDGNDR